MGEPNFYLADIRQAHGLATSSEICKLKGYPSTSVLNRLIIEKRAPKPDLVLGEDNFRLWKLDRLDEFPSDNFLKIHKKPHTGECDPAIHMDAKQLKLLLDTRVFYVVLNQARR